MIGGIRANETQPMTIAFSAQAFYRMIGVESGEKWCSHFVDAEYEELTVQKGS
jgi:hypothetical protein